MKRTIALLITISMILLTTSYATAAAKRPWVTSGKVVKGKAGFELHGTLDVYKFAANPSVSKFVGKDVRVDISEYNLIKNELKISKITEIKAIKVIGTISRPKNSENLRVSDGKVSYDIFYTEQEAKFLNKKVEISGVVYEDNALDPISAPVKLLEIKTIKVTK